MSPPEPAPSSLLHEPVELSPAGRARRDRMLAELIPVVHARRRRRRATLAAGAALPLLLVTVAAWALRPSLPVTAPEPHQGPIAQTPADPQSTAAANPLAALIVRDRPELVEAAVVRGDVSRITRISDDELLAILDESGEPGGLIRTRGQALVAADVRGAAEPGAEPSGRLPNDPSGSGGDGPGPGVRLAAAYSRR